MTVHLPKKRYLQSYMNYPLGIFPHYGIDFYYFEKKKNATEKSVIILAEMVDQLHVQLSFASGAQMVNTTTLSLAHG